MGGLTECSRIDDQQDLEQAERSPVHEVVDLEDSESENEESEDEMQSGMLPRGVGGADDSVMVVDSDSEDGYDDDDEEEEEDDDDDMGRGFPLGRNSVPFRPQPGWKGSKGGADEPIEIESSSDEEKEEREKAKSATKKAKETNGNTKKIIEEAALKVNGGDPNLNLSEESSENEDDKSTETNQNKETEKDKVK